MNGPIFGCAGCATTAGAGACPVHSRINAADPAPLTAPPLVRIDGLESVIRERDEARALADRLARENHDIVARWELLGEEKRSLVLQNRELQKVVEVAREFRIYLHAPEAEGPLSVPWVFGNKLSMALAELEKTEKRNHEGGGK